MRFVTVMLAGPFVLMFVSTLADALRPIGLVGALWLFASVPAVLLYGVARVFHRARRDGSPVRPRASHLHRL